jgi:DNA replication and repair protein RecF
VVEIVELEVRGFRNLEPQTITFHPRFNVLSGDNGQGKTNVLEAIYLTATGRSFRTDSVAECVTHGELQARARARFLDRSEAALPIREQTVRIADGRRAPDIDGKRPPSLAAFALATPIVLFEPQSLRLSQGPAAERRKLLDRVAAHLAMSAGGGAELMLDAERYRRALQSRKRALEVGADARVLEPYERIMAEHGARIVRARRAAVAAIVPATCAAFADIAKSTARLGIAYAARAPDEADLLAAALAERRVVDARRGTATVGPHLDDLTIALDDHPVREVASQGQHRALVLALKAAELSTIAEARGVRPILLLDDVSSELDPTRNAALFAFLHVQQGQVVLTTTRPEVLAIDSERRDLRVRSGRVTDA